MIQLNRDHPSVRKTLIIQLPHQPLIHQPLIQQPQGRTITNNNDFSLILFLAAIELSFVVGMVTDLEMCTQKTPMDILALYVMMAGEHMRLMLCAGTTPFSSFTTTELRAFQELSEPV